MLLSKRDQITVLALARLKKAILNVRNEIECGIDIEIFGTSITMNIPRFGIRVWYEQQADMFSISLSSYEIGIGSYPSETAAKVIAAISMSGIYTDSVCDADDTPENNELIKNLFKQSS